MGDSDDEYDRRRARDKFRRERSDYQEHRGEDSRNRREDYVERRDVWGRDRGGRRDYREVDPRRRGGGGGGGDRYSPAGQRHDISPPMKKMRRDWEDRGYGVGYDGGAYGGTPMGSHQNWGNLGPEIGGGGGGGNVHSHNAGYGGGGGHGDARGHHRDGGDAFNSQPPVMTFKQFLASQDDGIGDEEAVRKYNDYKVEFKRQQLNKFFLAHKEEEWFKTKYQPEESAKRRHDHLASLNRRIDVFLEFIKTGRIDSLSVDSEKSEDIIKLLDAVVIKLEGGTDGDLKVLEENGQEEERGKPPLLRTLGNDDIKKKAPPADSSKDATDQSDAVAATPAAEIKDNDELKTSVNTVEEGEEGALGVQEVTEAVSKKKSTGKFSSDEENEESGCESGKGADDEGDRHGSPISSLNEGEDKAEDGDSQPTAIKEEKKDAVETDNKDATDAISEDGSANEKPVDTPLISGPPPPRALHRTCSIFLRNLAPTITKQEVEAMCRRFPGFLRVAIADPQPERRFFRRGWVTFDRTVNIKEICWNLNNIRLRDCELGAIVNRDLTRRIRSCSGITVHKQVVRADIKHAAKLVQMLDSRNDLWVLSDKGEPGNGQLSFGLISRNPLLKNITDYLIEEASAEEEELLGTAAADDFKKDGECAENAIERDESLIKVLDRLLLYLRIVHSVDYYNHSDYPNEDEMPNRCGIMHARGPPLNKVAQQEIGDYIANFEMRLGNFLQPVPKLATEEAVKLGKKDPTVEVEKFVVANTQELGKDKWLCPLSGKKFKGPEFVRKHIFNKHSEKIEEVKKEVEYFNNYLMDSKRPQLQEHPGNRAPRGPDMGAAAGGREVYGQNAPGYQGHHPHGYGYGQNARMQGAPGYSGRGRENYGDNYRNTGGGGGAGFFNHKRGSGRNRGDPREIVGYHDLDAPDDLDVF